MAHGARGLRGKGTWRVVLVGFCWGGWHAPRLLEQEVVVLGNGGGGGRCIGCRDEVVLWVVKSRGVARGRVPFGVRSTIDAAWRSLVNKHAGSVAISVFLVQLMGGWFFAALGA